MYKEQMSLNIFSNVKIVSGTFWFGAICCASQGTGRSPPLFWGRGRYFDLQLRAFVWPNTSAVSLSVKGVVQKPSWRILCCSSVWSFYWSYVIRKNTPGDSLNKLLSKDVQSVVEFFVCTNKAQISRSMIILVSLFILLHAVCHRPLLAAHYFQR